MYELPYGNTQQLNLDWFIKRWNEFYAQWQETEAGIDHALDAEIQRVEDAMTDLYAARDAAAASATAAAASASSASNDATIATNAATAAAQSATLANTKATAAGISEANAAQSATAAANSAGAAATSASQASASDTSATASATAAARSATAAGNSATAAAGSATAAGNSATAAAASAQEAEDVLDSIPADYTSLVINFHGNTGELTNDLMPDNNGDLFALNQLTPTAVNERKVYAHGNTFGTKTFAGKTGTTYYTFALSKDLKFIGNSDSNVLSTLTLSDFTPIEIPVNKTLQVHFTYKGKNTESGQTRVGGAFKIYTINPDTLEISSVGFQGFAIASATDGVYSYFDFDVIATDSMPQIYDNKNILVAYQSRNASVDEEFTVNIGLHQQNTANKKYRTLYNLFGYVENRFVATKAYNVNDCFVCGNTLYIVTAPIAIDEAITIGTNAAETSVSTLITQLLNS